ncbi:mandelate racemase/muconate lactonizing enzyme family protein [Candidatus Lucifugimonas marina]|uniref:Mandelate racemase/muconate lactonizing enzyme family protein n=1 Tax=Candidatus Lucifugimonas marina TaxID=3038979 RepID=A0AAJ5ZDY3_9CHLR|nr:mandelate racemase/muconate lactonizing enzyme family protein [SAR202 cluster bacterium JH702]MDG0868869.1 mandelate racemase/muconate lactonizing enzyme family protein [SAR202 cluster bacterium JH639]WFG35497.1 mandelate racemase/muconate lactonizing enzyme family protein [SAR202 cluster bacterium JH545]WFG39444.1 mandelate racemase/muconate lactonizing enzyme family protein [SAR202 cluster bacterium JH1073]
MKITDLKVAVLGDAPVVRVTTDEGIDGIGAGETFKPYLKPMIEFYRDMIIGKDPTNVERVMLGIRRMGSFKPWGTAVSAIEMALWDIAGKAANLPAYKLLGGKILDKVQVYNGNVRYPMDGDEPEHFAENMQKLKDHPYNFSIIKEAVSFHGAMHRNRDDFHYATAVDNRRYPNRGTITPKGFKYLLACIEAMQDVLGDDVGLALDCGPGMTVPDALRLAKELEGSNIMWLEDMVIGNYHPYVLADQYTQITPYTSTPIHTGEQIYLRQNFVELIERNAVNVLGPDVADVGGIAEMKFIAEYADLHGILFAPHGTFDGLIGLAAQTHMAAVLPDNYIAFELPQPDPLWWLDIMEGEEQFNVTDSHIDVPDTPGLGLTFIPEEAKKYLREEDTGFFDD